MLMQNKERFVKLFQPVSIGQMSIRNRLVMPPMGTNYATLDGYVTQRSKDYYEARARGGVGLIIVEVTCVDSPVGKTIIRQLAIDDDKFIPGLRELAQTIQRHGAKAAVQLHHAGRAAKMSFTRMQPVAPSAIPDPGGYLSGGGYLPRELTPSEIAQVVARFAAGAERTKRAGFDGVEIHAAHHYLISQFLSSASNKRQAPYGGELRNRARLLLEVIGAIREAVGKSYPVWCRLNGMEYGIKDGITLEETLEIARLAQEAGVDAIHVSAWPIPVYRFPAMAEPPGNMVHLAEAVKKVVTVPVIAVGKITPEVGERVLQEGKADLIAMGKALIADPELPNKLASGRLEDIIPCIGCIYCHDTLRDFGTEDGYLCCAVNTMTGREREYAITAARKTKRVLVVGGGPAGMEAARVARLRGHAVMLYEKGRRLGGQLLLARVPPHKDGIDVLINYLAGQVTKLGVNVELGKEVTPQLVEELKPDAVILATGARPLIPEIPGIDRENVVLAEEALAGNARVGDRVVVIGGGLVGCETAEFLVAKAKVVTIVEMLPELAKGVGMDTRRLLLERLAAKGVSMLTGVRCKRVTDRGLTIITGEGKTHTLPVDTIVLAAGAKPNQELFPPLRSMVSEIYLVGDCREPRRILEDIHEASQVARLL
jgi:2,4-dienoyl-CoA reductase-like NADH-dependent reductase (Old Yellow Enzyme family)/thioredoxin reductase